MEAATDLEIISESEAVPNSSEDTISLHIINEDGTICHLLRVTADQKMSDILRKSLRMFYKGEKKSIFKFNVILIRTGELLNRFHTVKDNNLTNEDELLLVERYVTPDEILDSPKDKPNSVAHRSNIEVATKNMKTKNKKKKKILDYKSPQCDPFHFQIELNNAFLNLIEFSSRILHYDDAKAVFKDIVTKLGLDLEPDTVRLRHITSMGYGVEISRIAMSLHKNNVKAAVEWLALEADSITDEDIAEMENLTMNYDRIDVTRDNFPEVIKNLSKYLLKRQEFCVEIDEAHMVKMYELGFKKRSRIRRALRQAFNEPNRASLILLDEPHNASATLDESTTSGVVVDKILREPDFLVALSDRNLLIGLLDLIDSPDNLVSWPEGGMIDSFLHQIAHVFETEKHYLHGCRDLFPPQPFIVVIN